MKRKPYVGAIVLVRASSLAEQGKAVAAIVTAVHRETDSIQATAFTPPNLLKSAVRVEAGPEDWRWPDDGSSTVEGDLVQLIHLLGNALQLAEWFEVDADPYPTVHKCPECNGTRSGRGRDEPGHRHGCRVGRGVEAYQKFLVGLGAVRP